MTRSSTAVSIAVHSGLAAILFFASAGIAAKPKAVSTISLAPLLAPYRPVSHNALGGGGGMRQKSPATEGHLPKIAPRQFVAPTIEILNPHPKLVMEATIEAPPDAALLNRPLPNLGDPLSQFVGSSAGTGGPLGIGNGTGTGVGDKRGPAAGSGDSLVGTVYRPGNGVTVPVLIHSVEPEFSEQARRAKHSGIVMIRADVDTTGRPRNIRVVQTLGMGLDEKAVEAVAQWLFRPGTKDGKPVAVSALVEVRFQLL